MIFYQINVELQTLNARYNALKTDMKNTRGACTEMGSVNEKLEDRIIVLEEEVGGLKTENNELRVYLNKVTEELNAVITLLNTRYAEEA